MGNKLYPPPRHQIQWLKTLHLSSGRFCRSGLRVTLSWVFWLGASHRLQKRWLGLQSCLNGPPPGTLMQTVGRIVSQGLLSWGPQSLATWAFPLARLQNGSWLYQRGNTHKGLCILMLEVAACHVCCIVYEVKVTGSRPTRGQGTTSECGCQKAEVIGNHVRSCLSQMSLEHLHEGSSSFIVQPKRQHLITQNFSVSLLFIYFQLIVIEKCIPNLKKRKSDDCSNVGYPPKTQTSLLDAVLKILGSVTPTHVTIHNS